MTTLNTYKSTGIEDWGPCTSDDFKNFIRLYRNKLNRMCKDNNWQLVNFSTGHYYASWFVKNSEGKHIYMSFSDVRYFNKSWYNSILYRTAKDEKDYTGGSNWYTDLNNMESHLKKMFERNNSLWN